MRWTLRHVEGTVSDRTSRSKYATTTTCASPASTISTARRRPARFASAVPPETSSSSIVSTSRGRRGAATERIRSACSLGDTNDSPSRAPTRLTRTTPTALRTEARLPVKKEPQRLTSRSHRIRVRPCRCPRSRGNRLYCIFTPRTTRPAARSRPAASATRGASSRARAPSCSASAPTARRPTSSSSRSSTCRSPCSRTPTTRRPRRTASGSRSRCTARSTWASSGRRS